MYVYTEEGRGGGFVLGRGFPQIIGVGRHQPAINQVAHIDHVAPDQHHHTIATSTETANRAPNVEIVLILITHLDRRVRSARSWIQKSMHPSIQPL